MMADVAAIEVEGLTKTYRRRAKPAIEAVRGIDLAVAEGEILAFLGVNGAGKTTVVEILEGFRRRTSGRVQVLGHDPETAPLGWREDIGVVLQESEASGDLTAREVLDQLSIYYEDPSSVDHVLEVVGLSEHSGQRAAKLSGGQKRRLDMAGALVGNPKLVFLDEPTTGFDPSARRSAWGMIGRLRQLGVTVFLTTHYMDEAEHLADRIVLIDDGLIVADGTAGGLVEQVGLGTLITWDTKEVALEAVPERLRASVVVEQDQARIQTRDVANVTAALAKVAIAKEIEFESLEVSRPSLESVFLELTGPTDGSNSPSAANSQD